MKYEWLRVVCSAVLGLCIVHTLALLAAVSDQFSSHIGVTPSVLILLAM